MLADTGAELTTTSLAEGAAEPLADTEPEGGALGAGLLELEMEPVGDTVMVCEGEVAGEALEVLDREMLLERVLVSSDVRVPLALALAERLGVALGLGVASAPTACSRPVRLPRKRLPLAPGAAGVHPAPGSRHASAPLAACSAYR